MAALAGCRVDEEMVVRAYEACLEIDADQMLSDLGAAEGPDYLGGEKGKRVVEMALAASRG